jgi:hypothetical protein
MPLERLEDLHATLAISQQEAKRGTIRTLSLPGKRQVQITVPAQAWHGQILRLEGLGIAPYEGGPRSALRLTIAIVEENATQHSQSMKSYKPTETTHASEQISPHQTRPTWNTQPDLPHYDEYTYTPPPTTYSSYPAIPFHGAGPVKSYRRDQQATGSARKHSLAASLLLVIALLILSSSAWLFYNNYVQPRSTPSIQKAAQSSTHPAQTIIQKQNNNPIPNPEPAPNPYITGTSKLLLDDPLSKPSKSWQIEAHDTLGGSCVISSNAYHAQESQKGYFRICSAQSIDVSDFVFEVHMQIISGHCGGILFRQLSIGQYYLYRVCSDGYYGLTRYTDNTGQNSFSISYATSPSIHQGNKENVIAIVAQGPRIHLYINNIDIGNFSDGNYLHGMLGLIAEYKDTPVDVAYSRVRIWSLVV